MNDLSAIAGRLLDMPFDEYAAIDATNASAIKAGALSMKHMKHYMDKGRADSRAMKRGRMLHAAVLEPERFFASVEVWRGYEKKDGTTGYSKASKAWTNFADGKDQDLVLLPDELADMHAASLAVHADEDAHRIIALTESERSLVWHDDLYGWGKARFDCVDGQVIADYKTTRNIEPGAFARSFANMSYDVQLGWYAHGFRKAFGRDPVVYVIAQEQYAPWDVVVYLIDHEILREGERKAVEIARMWHISKQCGTFLGVANAEGIRQLELPQWASSNPDAVPEMED